jgi:hypothetical protein
MMLKFLIDHHLEKWLKGPPSN